MERNLQGEKKANRVKRTTKKNHAKGSSSCKNIFNGIRGHLLLCYKLTYALQITTGPSTPQTFWKQQFGIHGCREDEAGMVQMYRHISRGWMFLSILVYTVPQRNIWRIKFCTKLFHLPKKSLAGLCQGKVSLPVKLYGTFLAQMMKLIAEEKECLFCYYCFYICFNATNKTDMPHSYISLKVIFFLVYVGQHDFYCQSSILKNSNYSDHSKRHDWCCIEFKDRNHFQQITDTEKYGSTVRQLHTAILFCQKKPHTKNTQMDHFNFWSQIQSISYSLIWNIGGISRNNFPLGINHTVFFCYKQDQLYTWLMFI